MRDGEQNAKEEGEDRCSSSEGLNIIRHLYGRCWFFAMPAVDAAE